MQTLFGNNAEDLELLEWLGATRFLAAEVDLFTNDILPTRELLLGDYDIATYSGYAAEVVTWQLPSIADDGSPELVSDMLTFRPTGTAVVNTIRGGILRSVVAPTGLSGAFRFDGAARPMGSPLDVINVILRLRLQLGGVVIDIS